MAHGLHAEDRWVPGAFDPEELCQKYRDKRDKRLRPDGKAQYLDVAGNFGRFAADPYLEPTERDLRVADVDVLILGGWSGLQWQSGSRGQANKTFSSSTKRATSVAAGPGAAVAAAGPSPP